MMTLNRSKVMGKFGLVHSRRTGILFAGAPDRDCKMAMDGTV